MEVQVLSPAPFETNALFGGRFTFRHLHSAERVNEKDGLCLPIASWKPWASRSSCSFTLRISSPIWSSTCFSFCVSCWWYVSWLTVASLSKQRQRCFHVARSIAIHFAIGPAASSLRRPNRQRTATALSGYLSFYDHDVPLISVKFRYSPLNLLNRRRPLAENGISSLFACRGVRL